MDVTIQDGPALGEKGSTSIPKFEDIKTVKRFTKPFDDASRFRKLKSASLSGGSNLVPKKASTLPDRGLSGDSDSVLKQSFSEDSGSSSQNSSLSEESGSHSWVSPSLEADSCQPSSPPVASNNTNPHKPWPFASGPCVAPEPSWWNDAWCQAGEARSIEDAMRQGLGVAQSCPCQAGPGSGDPQEGCGLSSVHPTLKEGDVYSNPWRCFGFTRQFEDARQFRKVEVASPLPEEAKRQLGAPLMERSSTVPDWGFSWDSESVLKQPSAILQLLFPEQHPVE